MISHIIIAPVLVHLFTAIVLLAFWEKIFAHRIISIVGSLLGLIISVRLFTRVLNGPILTMNAANWDAPFGIVFVGDLMSTTFVLLTSIVALAVSIYSATGVSKGRIRYGYFPIFHFLILGLNGAFLTGDIFNLYVWFEVIIISSFVLLTIGGRKPQLEGAVKYMTLNILASTFFLTGIAILYGITGTLNIADLSQKILLVEKRAIVNMTAMFFVIGFGIKSALFPLYFWLPSSYHTPPSAVAAVFGGLLTKVGIYGFLRVFTLIFIPDDFIQLLLMGIGVMTIITGSFGAVIKNNLRRIFSYLILCHLGFVIGGLALFTEIAFIGLIFYLIHDIIIKSNLFLMAGLIRQLRGSMDLSRLGGIYGQYPKISLMMAVVLFSLAGIPPLSGFWPKIYLFDAGYQSSNYFFICGIIIGSFITLYLMAKIWSEVFWKDPKEEANSLDHFAPMPLFRKALLVFPIAFLAGVTLMIGLNAEFIIQVASKIAGEMADPTPYIEAVLVK